MEESGGKEPGERGREMGVGLMGIRDRQILQHTSSVMGLKRKKKTTVDPLIPCNMTVS